MTKAKLPTTHDFIRVLSALESSGGGNPGASARSAANALGLDSIWIGVDTEVCPATRIFELKDRYLSVTANDWKFLRAPELLHRGFAKFLEDQKEPNKAKPGSLISGTHAPQELIPAFLMCLEDVLGDGFIETLEKDYPDLVAKDGTFIPSCWDQVGSWWISDPSLDFLHGYLFDKLNEIAPEGHHFGAHEGDGSDFGFWPDEEEPEHKEYRVGWRLRVTSTSSVAAARLAQEAQRDPGGLVQSFYVTELDSHGRSVPDTTEEIDLFLHN